MLCEATTEPLHIIDFSKPFNVHVDASDYAVAGILSQSDENGREMPIAFASKKLSSAQKNWAIIEKEAYAALWALQKYRCWIFGANVIVYSDHNPLSYLTIAAPKKCQVDAVGSCPSRIQHYFQL